MTFIDPIPGQPLGPTEKADNLPFYDFTFNNLKDMGTVAPNGTGTYFKDTPFLSWNLLKDNKAFPATETFQTVLVALKDAPNKLLVLGGFQWGFTLSQKAGVNTVTLMDPVATEVPSAKINYASWQTALNNETWDQKYTIAQAMCDSDAVLVSFSIPEPSAIVLAIIGIPGMIAVIARQRQPAAGSDRHATSSCANRP